MIDALALSGRKLRTWLTSSIISGDTEVERSFERNRRAVVSSIAGLALRGSSFVVVLVSVPLTLDLLGPVRFGMWMTIASVVALLGVTDLGIGNGVLNGIAHAYGQGDTQAARQYLGSGFVALFGIALLLGILLLAVYPFIPWASLYNVAGDPLAASEAGPATLAFLGTFLVGRPLGIAGQVRDAYQEGFVQSAFAGLGNVLTVFLLMTAVAVRAGLPVLVLAMTSGPIIASILNMAVLVRHQRPWLAPRRSDITLDAMRSVVGIGLAFLVLQVAYTVGFSVDRLIVAHVVGPAAVADYSVVYRLFAIPAGLASIAALPLWPAYREAITRNDIAWVRLTLKRSLILTVCVTVPLAIALAIGGPTIIQLWTSQGVTPPYGLYVALAAFTVALAVTNVFSVLLNGAQVIRFLIATWSAMALLNLTVSIFLASRIGVAGVAVGSVIAVVVALIVPFLLYTPRLLRRLDERQRQSVGPPHRERRGSGCLESR